MSSRYMFEMVVYWKYCIYLHRKNNNTTRKSRVDTWWNDHDLRVQIIVQLSLMYTANVASGCVVFRATDMLKIIACQEKKVYINLLLR